MDWWEWILIGVFIGLPFGSFVATKFLMKYWDAIQLQLYRKWNNGEEPKYCLHCGALLNKEDEGD